MKQEKIRRILTLITPCKQSVTRGYKNTHPAELRRSATHYGVERWGTACVPALRFAYTGLSHYPALRFAYTGLSHYPALRFAYTGLSTYYACGVWDV